MCNAKKKTSRFLHFALLRDLNIKYCIYFEDSETTQKHKKETDLPSRRLIKEKSVRTRALRTSKKIRSDADFICIICNLSTFVNSQI